MKQTLERELKLEVEPGFRLPRLPGRPLAPRVFVSRYYDTPDHRLARHGVTLRCRIEKRRPLWQVKLPRRSGAPRAGAAGLVVPAPRRARAPPPRLHARGRARARSPRFARGAWASSCARRARPVAEVVLDSVAVLDGRRVKRRFREVEVELVGAGDEAVLERLGDAVAGERRHREPRGAEGLPGAGARLLSRGQATGPVRHAARPGAGRDAHPSRRHSCARSGHPARRGCGRAPPDAGGRAATARRHAGGAPDVRTEADQRAPGRAGLARSGPWRSARLRRYPGASARGASHARASGPRGRPGAARAASRRRRRALAWSFWWPSTARVT